MIIVDSCGWLEYFINGPLAGEYEKYLKKIDDLLTPTIVLYEVYKKVKAERGEKNALLIAAQMNNTESVPLTDSLALSAADISLKYKIPMADSIIKATADSRNCDIVTSDSHLKNLPNVIYLKKTT